MGCACVCVYVYVCGCCCCRLPSTHQGQTATEEQNSQLTDAKRAKCLIVARVVCCTLISPTDPHQAAAGLVGSPHISAPPCSYVYDALRSQMGPRAHEPQICHNPARGFCKKWGLIEVNTTTKQKTRWCVKVSIISGGSVVV